jgi:hypothetical protein
LRLISDPRLFAWVAARFAWVSARFAWAGPNWAGPNWAGPLRFVAMVTRRTFCRDGDATYERTTDSRFIGVDAPIIPRLKRLFRNKEHSRLLRWHKEACKKYAMLRHPAHGSQWRKIERDYTDFTGDTRNLRFGLSTDGMNPFGEKSSSHSTWPINLCIYNLPPWLCMKQKFIMMPVLIQGPKQPGMTLMCT